MNEKGFFASICDFFSGLFSSNNDDSLTGVERYIRNQANAKPSSLTGVEQYIRNLG